MAKPKIDDQLAKARENVEILKVQLEEDIDVANEMAYSDAELQRLLRKLPTVMFQASQRVVLKFIDFKDAKRMVKKELAIAMMQANAMRDSEGLTSEKDRTAWAQNQPNVDKAEIDLIQAEAVKEFLTMRGVAQDCEPMIHDWPARCSMVTANVELTGAARLYRAASSDRRERG